MKLQRPRATRYRFNVSAILTDLDSGQQSNGTTWDLSLLGCQVMVANFARVGARVRIQIIHNGDSFEAMGRVANLRPLMGVGIGFTIVEDRSHFVLDKWLEELREKKFSHGESTPRHNRRSRPNSSSPKSR